LSPTAAREEPTNRNLQQTRVQRELRRSEPDGKRRHRQEAPAPNRSDGVGGDSHRTGASDEQTGPRSHHVSISQSGHAKERGHASTPRQGRPPRHSVDRPARTRHCNRASTSPGDEDARSSAAGFALGALASLATAMGADPGSHLRAITDVTVHYLRVGNHTHLRSFARGARRRAGRLAAPPCGRPTADAMPNAAHPVTIATARASGVPAWWREPR
jgi:hypothetical protein